MKRFFSLICVFLLIFAVVSCGGKKKEEKPAYEEQVTKEISAKEGGKIESKDGKTSIEIPADALDENLTITMTIYDAKGYKGTEGQEVVSKVVEFEPSGIVFKKPVIITMASTESFENKILTAAVYRETKGEWSYNEHGVYVVLAGREAAGDPVMQSAAGDPIMLSAAGDPIMQSTGEGLSAAGDPIMLASAGDPIMSNAAGDPIMNAAAGDPIMMTTGHFTAYTFITLESTGPVEEPDEKPENDEEITDEDDDDPEITDTEIQDTEIQDEEIPDEIEDEDENPDVDEDIVVPEPELVLSKVLCTGQIHCTNGNSIIDCPEEGEEFYGQDAQAVANNLCVPHKYIKVNAAVEDDDPEDGEGTGLRNILHGNDAARKTKGGIFKDVVTGESYEHIIDENTGLKWVLLDDSTTTYDNADERCAALDYGGYEWRLPTAKEFLSISDHDRYEPAVNEFYFRNIGAYFWTSTPVSGRENYFWVYYSGYAVLEQESSNDGNYTACVTGEEYGKPGVFEVKNIGGKEVVFDPSTNLFWQKEPTSVESWKDALAYCSNLEYAGFSDWRLPNKNELVTLVDYSKSNPASSFPGMTSENLVSSTFMVSYGGSESPISIDMESGFFEQYYGDASVRCVRSDVKPLAAGKMVPVCDESRRGPCEDAATGRIWSNPEFSAVSNYSSMSWMDKAVQCRESKEGGITQWRMPTIDEIRELLPSSEALKTGGECKVTNECFDYADEECFNEAVCSHEEGGEMIMSSLFDYMGYISGTMNNQDDEVWAVDLGSSSLFSFSDGYILGDSRCIYDASIPNPTFPYTDSDTNLIWSSRYRNSVEWYVAARYCADLGEGGSNNWRVPTVDELKTLVRNCPEDDCDFDSSGKYSLFGDLHTLWSSDVEDGGLFGLDFAFAGVYGLNPSYSYFVRCVRRTDEPETETELEFPFEIGDLIWSKVSDEDLYTSDAGEYCEALNEENYGGRNDWELPEPYEVATLIKESVCPNKNDFTSFNPNTTSRCDIYTFDGYSIFGDMFRLLADGGYAFDFARGGMNSSSYGRVRCVIRVD